MTRRSFPYLSRAVFSTLSASVLQLFYVLQSGVIFLSCSDLDDLRDIVNEDLAVSDMSRIERSLGCLDHLVHTTAPL